MSSTQIFAKVLNMSLTASLVIVLVIAAGFILRKSPKVLSYALWAVVLFRLLCPASLPSPAKSVSAAEIITYVWIVGMAVLFLVDIGSYFRFRRHLTGACQLQGNIYLVDHIDSAFVAGLFSPRIYLPSDLPVKQMPSR